VFTKISFGSNHSLGLDDVNQIWAWGYNSYGQLGDNTTISKSTPVSVVR
jgi:alpha-tubulin suppressor-like RCC1 family protein